MKVAVCGASGYTGQVLTQLLSSHPGVEKLYLIGREREGETFQSFSPLYPEIPFVSEEKLKEADYLFLCLPDGESMKKVPSFLEAGKKVIDLSGDYRVSLEAFHAFYGIKHEDAQHLQEAIYGLPELFEEKIRKARLVANPGCYATAAILALYPLVKEDILASDFIVFDAKSGVSGAGRKPSLRTHFVEVNESIEPYNPCHHDQIPEIEEAIEKKTGKAVRISFTPHLLPQSQGILVSLYGKTERKEKEVQKAFEETYLSSPFVRVIPELPKTKWVSGTPYLLLKAVVDERACMIKVFSALDNLWKGAASQAIENFNLMAGYERETGLERKKSLFSV